MTQSTILSVRRVRKFATSRNALCSRLCLTCDARSLVRIKVDRVKADIDDSYSRSDLHGRTLTSNALATTDTTVGFCALLTLLLDRVQRPATLLVG